MIPLRTMIRVLIWGVLPALAGGCAVAAFTATLFPPDKVKPEYEFDEKSRLLVLVEDPKHLGDKTSLRVQLSEILIQEFEDRGLVERVVPLHQLMNLAAASENFHALSTAEVGAKLKANVVLYVEIKDFSLKDEPNSPFWHGKLSTETKVISVKEGRLWPKDSPDGYSPSHVDTGSVSGEGSMRYEQHMVQTMALEMGDNIMKLFYLHRGKEHGSLPESDTVDRP